MNILAAFVAFFSVVNEGGSTTWSTGLQFMTASIATCRNR